jgi:hypothetical protein
MPQWLLPRRILKYPSLPHFVPCRTRKHNRALSRLICKGQTKCLTLSTPPLQEHREKLAIAMVGLMERALDNLFPAHWWRYYSTHPAILHDPVVLPLIPAVAHQQHGVVQALQGVRTLGLIVDACMCSTKAVGGREEGAEWWGGGARGVRIHESRLAQLVIVAPFAPTPNTRQVSRPIPTPLHPKSRHHLGARSLKRRHTPPSRCRTCWRTSVERG